MHRVRAIAILVLVAASLPATADTALPTVLQVLGKVTNAAQPVGSALVIALNVATFDAIQTYSSADGSFTLPPLRAGVYKVMAAKTGFVPAIATIVPSRADHRLSLRLENEKQAKRNANQEIWEIRGSLPPDILRELDLMLGVTGDVVPTGFEVPRIRGEMMSMTAVVPQQSAGPRFSQTALGVQGRIGENWQVGIRGNMQRSADPALDAASDGTPLSESSTMSMEVRSSPNEAYRFASAKSAWMYRDAGDGGSVQADVRAHNFEWEHGDARVQVRYVAQDNLFSAASAGSNTIEVAGNTTLVQTRRNDFGVQLRVTQQSIDGPLNSSANTLRVADFAANGSFALVPALMLHYGVASRLALDAQEWAPSTGASWKIGKHTSLLASGSYKVTNDRTAASRVLPMLVVWSEDTRILPRYSYSVGFTSGKDENNRFTAMATVSEIDAPLRVAFTDNFDQFWDGLSVESGDVRRDIRFAYRKELGAFAVDVATTAGNAQPRLQERAAKEYVIGDLQSTFLPTRTTLAVSYRELLQPGAALDGRDYRSERVNVRMAQSLYLPIDMKLLLGIEMARSENSPYLLDHFLADGSSRKYVGGLAVNF